MFLELDVFLSAFPTCCFSFPTCFLRENKKFLELKVFPTLFLTLFLSNENKQNEESLDVLVFPTLFLRRKNTPFFYFLGLLHLITYIYHNYQ